MKNSDLIIKIISNGLSFDQFIKLFVSEIANTNKSKMTNEEKRRLDFTKLNFTRTERILKTYKISSELLSLIEHIETSQLWMVLTEAWCGDSAQTLPQIYKMIESNKNIELKILQREKYPSIMDRYLTNGTRSIPKLIAFNEMGDELFQWGPRPDEAKNLVMQWKSDGETPDQYNEKLHLWYGRNRGKSLEKEFIKLLSK